MRRFNRHCGFSLLETLVCIALIGILLSAAIFVHATFRKSEAIRAAQVAEKNRQTRMEAAWALEGVQGPGTARIAMARRILIGQGIDPATVLDWSEAGLAGRTPPVITPDWLSVEASEIMAFGIE